MASGPDPGRAPPGSPDALRRLHERHAERLRTAARWLGIDDHDRDAAVTWCFRTVAAAVPEDSATGWAALMRALARARPSERGAPWNDHHRRGRWNQRRRG
jgi:branched-subunit amino acid aminotransferase/4-amino-4-deoxychorismate lyase